MNIRTIKLLKIILTILIIATCFVPHIAFAGEPGGESSGLKFSDAKDFINKGKEQISNKNGLSQTELTNVGNQFSDIAKILTYIGAGILVGAMAYMGIIYMTAEPAKQAKLKEQLIGLVVSAIVIFGAYFIWSTIYTLLNETFN